MNDINELKQELGRAQRELRTARLENTDVDLIANLEDEVLSIQGQIRDYNPPSHAPRTFEISNDDGNGVRAVITKE